jgi:hypothetical protein
MTAIPVAIYQGWEKEGEIREISRKEHAIKAFHRHLSPYFEQPGSLY